VLDAPPREWNWTGVGTWKAGAWLTGGIARRWEKPFQHVAQRPGTVLKAASLLYANAVDLTMRDMVAVWGELASSTVLSDCKFWRQHGVGETGPGWVREARPVAEEE